MLMAAVPDPLAARDGGLEIGIAHVGDGGRESQQPARLHGVVVAFVAQPVGLRRQAVLLHGALHKI